ncbi:hypothetical protein [Halopiger goleimassiliensis]|uniref:hypothetical protein n=1 Tax=Halopiger goleimassiliensis TaxID=1293048 RepID=UPI000677813A|nr:hypothetical protein [Halopiger goleimassiliensis]
MERSKAKARAEEYLERETAAFVRDLEFAESFDVHGERSYVFTARTSAGDRTEWWVVAGGLPTGHYPRAEFDDPTGVFAYHMGATAGDR